MDKINTKMYKYSISIGLKNVKFFSKFMTKSNTNNKRKKHHSNLFFIYILVHFKRCNNQSIIYTISINCVPSQAIYQGENHFSHLFYSETLNNAILM